MHNADDINDIIKKSILKYVDNNYQPDIDINKIQQQDNLEQLVSELCYHNYSNWQHENDAKSSDDNISLIGYKRTVTSNHNRNKTITLIDDYFYDLQNNEAVNIIPTTIGTIIDAISVLFLKFTYLQKKEATNFQRAENILKQIIEITNALSQSLEKVYKEKTFRFIRLDKIKIYSQQESIKA